MHETPPAAVRPARLLASGTIFLTFSVPSFLPNFQVFRRGGVLAAAGSVYASHEKGHSSLPTNCAQTWLVKNLSNNCICPRITVILVLPSRRGTCPSSPKLPAFLFFFFFFFLFHSLQNTDGFDAIPRSHTHQR